MERQKREHQRGGADHVGFLWAPLKPWVSAGCRGGPPKVFSEEGGLKAGDSTGESRNGCRVDGIGGAWNWGSGGGREKVE